MRHTIPCSQCSLSALCLPVNPGTYFDVDGCHYCGRLSIEMHGWLAGEERCRLPRVPPTCPQYIAYGANPQHCCLEKECRDARHRWRLARNDQP